MSTHEDQATSQLLVVEGPTVPGQDEPIYQVTLSNGCVLTRPAGFAKSEHHELLATETGRFFGVA